MKAGKKIKPGNLVSDLVVIGGGGAGLAAAVATAEKGASVTVLEKRATTGGNAIFAHGIFAAESPVQKRVGIEARRDDLFKVAMDYAHWKLDARIVRAWIDKSGDTIRWLEQKGIKFNIVPMLPTHDMGVFHWSDSVQRMKVLTKICKDTGAQVLCRTSAKKILTSENGNVTGVVAEARGEEFVIKARSVFIATGGFGGNKELLKKYCPDYRDNMVNLGLPLQGDGVLMAMEVGAATDGLSNMLVCGHAPAAPRSTVLKIDHPKIGIVRIPLGILSEPYTLWVNKNGERFTDEAVSLNGFEAGNTVLRQVDGTCYTIFDAEIVSKVAVEGTIMRRYRMPETPGPKMPGLGKALEEHAHKGYLNISDSWDSIASWMGADSKVVKATVDEYNTACDKGYDPIFAKDKKYLLPLRNSPYYAIKCYVSYLDTMGGLKINERMEVLDKQGKTIPGLYAGGVDTGGWESDTYNTLLSGSAISFAFNSGRIAGENVVKFISGYK